MPRTTLTPHQQRILVLALERERSRLLDDIAVLDESSRVAGEAQEGTPADDPSGTASDLVQQELGLALSHIEKAHLDQVEAALHRTTQGSYGLCEHCGQPIGFPRLHALPWARNCRRCIESVAPRGVRAPAPALRQRPRVAR
jgi:RNA polymerase-binding transcription factor DksA